MRTSSATAIALAVSLSGCASTQYMGRVPRPSPEGSADVSDEPREPVVPLRRTGDPSGDPRLVAVTPSGTIFDLGNGNRLLVPNGNEYNVVEKHPGTGAIEGLLMGAIAGLVIGGIVVAKNDCSSWGGCVTSVPGVFALSGLLGGAVGALYGAAVGHTTTYHWGRFPTR